MDGETPNEELLNDLSSSDIAEAVGAAARVRSHLAPNAEDVCGYCGQAFGPDVVAVERELYGRRWRFCDESCLDDFREKSNFRDEDLDEDREGSVRLTGS